MKKRAKEVYTLSDLHNWSEITSDVVPPIRLGVIGDPVAHSLSPEMLTSLANHFKDLNPKPLGGAPEELVDQVIAKLAPRDGVTPVRVTDEDEYFPPPRNIRDLQAAIETATTTMLGGSLAGRKVIDDRRLAASDVLAALRG